MKITNEQPNSFNKYILDVPYISFLMICLTLGLAPFNPPHVWEKLMLLFSGNLVKLIDWFDLLMHGAPWVLLGIKFVLEFQNKKALKDKGLSS